jgi:hypothetical protein
MKQSTRDNEICRWEDDNGVYITSCKNAFELSNFDGLEKNGMKFCPYCGCRISERKGA